jgi:hypothetical protein
MATDLAQKGTEKVTSVIGKYRSGIASIGIRLTPTSEATAYTSRVYGTINPAMRFHIALWPTKMKMNDAITNAQ